MAENYMSRDGLEKMRKRLGELRKEKVVLTAEIAEAASQGDLKENVGYHAAKERQADVARRIGDIEKKLLSVRLIEDLDIPKDEVRIGATITLAEEPSGDEWVWTLVDEQEADVAAGKISVRAPLSQGLLGHKAGETVRVELPIGPTTFKIIKIER
ncbi:MAG: transcription elongation factor GreA [Elusimicrobiota bacterium]